MLFSFRYCFLLRLILPLFLSILSLTILLFFHYTFLYSVISHFISSIFCLPVIFLVLLSLTVLQVFFPLSFISLVMCLFLLQSFHVPFFFL